MFDCAKDVLAYHDDEVTLPQKQRNQMRDRRDANRDRLAKGLKDAEKPAPNESKSQGSYAMKTMVQYPEQNYDIDDGAYFEKSKLVGPRGAEMSALEARQMVRDALDDGSFKTPPKTHNNCVRVTYDAGYNVDIPVYRRVILSGEGTAYEKSIYELAGTEWKRSDARDVTDWFERENDRRSPDDTNGRQLRRVTREIKKYARSRSSWDGQILGGFGITALVVECFKANVDREDRALYDTMKAIRDRLDGSLSIAHPVTPNETITADPDDAKARVLREKLTDAIDWLQPLFETDCDRETALKCWDKVYSTTFFIDRLEKKDSSANEAASSSVVRSVLAATARPDVVRKQGGGRYA